MNVALRGDVADAGAVMVRCFENTAHADEFVKRFDGERVALLAKRPLTPSFGVRGLWSKRRA